MKSLTVRLPDKLVAQLEAESRRRKLSKSDIVRERLAQTDEYKRSSPLELIADIIGSIDDLPPDMSSRPKHYLKATGYGRKRAR